MWRVTSERLELTLKGQCLYGAGLAPSGVTTLTIRKIGMAETSMGACGAILQ
jgi:hypothetical protein